MATMPCPGPSCWKHGTPHTHTLSEKARARRKDPATSKRAAASVTNMTDNQKAILEALKDHGPMTDEQIFVYVSHLMSPSGARSRRNELHLGGLVRDTGRVRYTVANRETTIWEAV